MKLVFYIYIFIPIQNNCLLSLKKYHKKMKKTGQVDCPACFSILFNPLKSSNVLACGHEIHVDCMMTLIENNTPNCLLCGKPMLSKQDWNIRNQIMESLKSGRVP
jgi:hypothetical protein